jgi:hypothetical protein
VNCLLKISLRLCGAGLGLLDFLLAEEEKSLNLIGQGVLLALALGDTLAANEGGNNAGTDNEGQHESVHAVPVRSKATAGGTSVVVVQEGESKELCDESVLNGEQERGPCDSRRNASGSISPESVLSTVSSPL